MKAIKKNLWRFLAVLLCACALLCSLPLSASAEGRLELPAADDIPAFVLYSITGNKILASKNPNGVIYPSATVKIMSALLLCEALEARTYETVTVSREMLYGVSGRTFGLTVGDTLLLEDLLKIAVCGSYNDAYQALAVIAEGSVEAFVEKMNKRAESLGALDTSFANVTGLDDPSALTSAHDVLKISLAAQENSLFMRFSSTYNYEIKLNGKLRIVENRNALHVSFNEFYNGNAFGLCTGSTNLGGNCLVTKGVYGDAEFLCVVMGAEENREYGFATALLSYADDNYYAFRLRDKGSYVAALPVTLSDGIAEIDLVLAEDINILLHRDDPVDDARSFDLVLTKQSLSAPVEAGTVVGYMAVRSGNSVLASVPVVTAKGAEANPFLTLLDSMKAFVTGRVFIAFVVCAVALTVLFFVALAIFTELSRKKRRRNYRVTRFR